MEEQRNSDEVGYSALTIEAALGCDLGVLVPAGNDAS